jgi:hypothetical protein
MQADTDNALMPFLYKLAKRYVSAKRTTQEIEFID